MNNTTTTATHLPAPADPDAAPTGGAPLAERETQGMVPAVGLAANSGFGVREPLWRKAGIVVPEGQRPTTWSGARTLAGLDWEPEEEPSYRRKVVIEDGVPVEKFVEVTGTKFIIRNDTDTILAHTNSTYQIISNSDLGLVMDALLGPENLRFETAGVLHGGRKVWALLEYADPFQLDGDPSPHRRYLGILSSHDGSAALRAINTAVRVSCWNSWKAADLDASSRGTCYSFHHSSGWQQRLDQVAEEAKKAISGAHQQTDHLITISRDLLDMPVTPEQEQRFCEEYIRPTQQDWRLKDRALENVNERRDYLLRMTRTSPTCEPIRRSAYRLVQAAGEYFDHERKTQKGGHEGDCTRFDRAVLSPSDYKRRARNLAELASAGRL